MTRLCNKYTRLAGALKHCVLCDAYDVIEMGKSYLTAVIWPEEYGTLKSTFTIEMCAPAAPPISYESEP